MNGKGKVFWSSVRRHYEMNMGTVAEICEMFNISIGSLYNHRRKGGWEKRRPDMCGGRKAGRIDGLNRKASQPSGEAQSRLRARGGKVRVAGKPIPDARQTKTEHESEKEFSGRSDGRADGNELSVGTRLFEVLEIKLAEIEDRIARGEQLSVEENEREQRVIGNLIRNFDKLTEFNERKDRGGDKAGRRGSGAAGAEDHAADLSKLNAVQFREEIARRIEHFEKERKS